MERKETGVPVLINLTSQASYQGYADEPIRVLTTGTLIPRGKDCLLKYTERTEDEQTGEIEEEQILLTLGKDQVTMNRTGAYANTMMFKKNRRFETSYRTPFGELPMAVFSREATARFRDGRGAVHLQYDLEFQGGLASTNELHLEFFQEEKHSKGGETHEKADQ